MPSLAIVLVLSAAVIHATWNFYLKKAGGGVFFLWLFASISAVLYLPAVIWIILVQKPDIGIPQIVFMTGSAVIHVGYFLMLGRGYGVADLSVVYPIARGTGPIMATVAAAAIFGERPGIPAVGGIICIASGIFLLTGDPRKFLERKVISGVSYALMTGCFIASYTVWDKYAVSTLAVHPVILDWASNFGRVLLLSCHTLRNPRKIREEVKRNIRWALIAGALCPLSYILVLTAMIFAPVWFVAPARELSILVGVLMGVRFLGEKDWKRKIAAAFLMIMGLSALSAGL